MRKSKKPLPKTSTRKVEPDLERGEMPKMPKTLKSPKIRKRKIV